MAVWWCCMCGVETRRDSEMVCGDCKGKNTLVHNGFRVTSGVELESPATAVTVPGGGRTVEESDMANSSPPGGGA